MTAVKEKPVTGRQSKPVVKKATNKAEYSFVENWMNQLIFWKEMSAMGVPTPTESWSCEKGRRAVLWDGSSLNLAGYTLYEVTHESRINTETGGPESTLIVVQQGMEEPEVDAHLLFQIRGIARWPAWWLIMSDLKWKLVVASNGFQSFIVSCEVQKED